MASSTITTPASDTRENGPRASSRAQTRSTSSAARCRLTPGRVVYRHTWSVEVASAGRHEPDAHHCAVSACAVVAGPDTSRAFIVKAYVVLLDPSAASDGLVAGLPEFVKREIAPCKYPRS